MLHRRGNEFHFGLQIMNGTTAIDLSSYEIDMYLLDDRDQQVLTLTLTDYLTLTNTNTRIETTQDVLAELDALKTGSYRYEMRIVQNAGNRSLITGKFSVVEPTHTVAIKADVEHVNSLIQVNQDPLDTIVNINPIYVFGLENKADLIDGKVPSQQLPSYVDDVLEFANLAAFPASGASGIIYIAIDSNLQYRWSGSQYVVMTSQSAVWGSISGNINNQTDLITIINGINSSLAGKYSTSNPSGYISGVTEAMVISALGYQPIAVVSEDDVLNALQYTPYDGDTNPMGFYNELAVASVGATPSAFAMEIAPNGTFTLQPANKNFPGLLTAGLQEIQGGKTVFGNGTTDSTYSLRLASNTGIILAQFQDGGTFSINNTGGSEIMRMNGSFLCGASRNCGIRPSTDLGATLNTNSQGILVGYLSNSSASGYPLVTLGMAGANAHTSGSSGLVRINGGFSQSSGSSTWEMLRFSGTINQSGTANGLLHCIRVNPTITAAANLRFLDLESPRTSANDTMLRIANNGGNIVEIKGNSQIGFFGVTPVSRQTGGAATAGGTYTAAEQTMLNAVYTALRNYGLLT